VVRRPVAVRQPLLALRGRAGRRLQAGAAGRRRRRLQGDRGGEVRKPPSMRVDRLLGSLGYGSRAEMARLGKAGGIVLDGVELTDVSKRIAVTPDLPSRMTVNGRPLDPPPGLALMLNKPLRMTCSHKEDGALVYDVLPDRWRRREPAISTIGRL